MTCSTLRPIALLGAALLASACVAKDSDSLGELDDASASASSGASGEGSGDGDDDGDGDDGATSGASGSADSADGASTNPMTSAGDDGDPPPLTCDPGLVPAEPASCPGGLLPALPGAGCYEECTGEGDACAVGTCQLVEYDPCPCPEGAEACCGACAGETWLCVEEVVDTFCENIVGTTFESLEELECGLSPKGPELCNWRITFEDDGEWLWMYSDIGQGGEYTCENGVLTITSDATIEHAWDPDTEILTWEGVEYQAVAP